MQGSVRWSPPPPQLGESVLALAAVSSGQLAEGRFALSHDGLPKPNCTKCARILDRGFDARDSSLP